MSDGTQERQDHDRAKGQKRRRRRGLLIFLLLLVVAGGAAGGYWYYRAQNFVSTDDAYVGADIVEVAPLVAGRVEAIEVEANTRVAAGDVLVRLDSAQAEAQLAMAKAQRSGAEAALEQAKARLRQARSAVRARQSALEAAQAKAKSARAQADRDERLANQSGRKAISDQKLLDAQTAASAAESDVAGARQQLEGATANVAAAQAGLKVAKAQVESAEAQVKLRQVELSHYTIRADIAGTVTQPGVNLGSFVQPGAHLLSLVPDDLYVTANFKETQIGSLHPGQDVDIAVDAYPDAEFHGTVASLQPGAGQAFQLLPPQNASGNFVKVVQRVPVRIAWDAPRGGDYAIGPGMSVVVTVTLDGG